MPITLVKDVMTEVVEILRVGDNLDDPRICPLSTATSIWWVLSRKSWWAPRMALTLRSMDRM